MIDILGEIYEPDNAQFPTITDREMRLVYNCIAYGKLDPFDAVPGHELMILVSKLAELIGIE